MQKIRELDERDRETVEKLLGRIPTSIHGSLWIDDVGEKIMKVEYSCGDGSVTYQENFKIST